MSGINTFSLFKENDNSDIVVWNFKKDNEDEKIRGVKVSFPGQDGFISVTEFEKAYLCMGAALEFAKRLEKGS